jgi:hypothetical protein
MGKSLTISHLLKVEKSIEDDDDFCDEDLVNLKGMCKELDEQCR